MLETMLLIVCQEPLAALASTTSDSRLAQDPIIHDEAWIRRSEGPPGAKAYLTRHAQMALAGDLDGDGLFDALGGVDALCTWPSVSSASPGPMDFCFSMVSDVGPFADGDLLRFDLAQGLVAVITEADFVAALQPASGSFDLDAATYRDSQDQLWFSVGSNLSGTVLGDVQDGDVLVWDRLNGVMSRAFTEAEVQALTDQATGGGTAIGDVLALSFLPGTMDLGYVVQAPSSLDGGVLVLDASGVAPPRILAGWEEVDWDFQQATEIDALAFVGQGLVQPPVLDLDLPFFTPGDVARFKLRHAIPGSVAKGFRGRWTAFDSRPGVGIGFLYLDPNDPILIAQVTHGNTHPQIVDPSGSASYDWTIPVLPPGLPFVDLYFQALDDSGGGWSAPIVLRIQ